jgi:hypothetical protein
LQQLQREARAGICGIVGRNKLLNVSFFGFIFAGAFGGGGGGGVGGGVLLLDCLEERVLFLFSTPGTCTHADDKEDCRVRSPPHEIGWGEVGSNSNSSCRRDSGSRPDERVGKKENENANHKSA